MCVCVCGGLLCNRADSTRNVLGKKKKKEKEKNGINMCFDMSEMFVSSLWKGDFDKLFTVMFAF